MALVTVQRSPTPSATSSPCVSETGSGEDDQRCQQRRISESFLTVKGAALFLPRGNGPSPSFTPHSGQQHSKHAGDLQQHLQTMFMLLRPEDSIRLAVRLESARTQCTRYMVVVTTNGRQDTEESMVLGIDFSSSDSTCTVGLVLPLWSDTLIHLDGDGGFSVSTVNRVHVFKPVSVQAMWSALQSLHKACEVARCHNYYPGSLFLTWVSYYQSRVASGQACINEWNAMQDLQSHRADSPVLFNDLPTERERTERLIKTRLREIMMQKDLENITSKEIRTELEMQMVCNLREFKEFIDNEMIVILGQMDSPTEIFEHVFLGSEWNASNLEELQSSGVRFILNVTREIDNFFPGLFEYHNIRVYDEEATDLLAYWNDTYKFISKAKKAGAKCLVHCKMGVSRSASTVIAYAMKEYGWDLERAFDHVKDRRTVAKPNPSFMRQLEEYQGILLASKQRHNKLWRSHSDSDLSERRESPCKTPHTLGRSDPHNDTSNGPPSLQSFLDTMDSLAAPDTAHRADPPSLDCQDGLANPVDRPLSSLPQPQAATVVPDEGLDRAAVNVAKSVLVGRPHPPPALHLLSLSAAAPLDVPELQAISKDASELPTAVPEQKRTSSYEPGVSEPLCQSVGCAAQVPEGDTPGASIANRSPLGTENDDPEETDQSGIPAPAAKTLPPQDPTSPPGTDSIDFFSARKKFVGLSQGSSVRSFSEQAPPQTPHLSDHLPQPQLLHPEDPAVIPVSAVLQDEDKVFSPAVESSDGAVTRQPLLEIGHMLTESEVAPTLDQSGSHGPEEEDEDAESQPESPRLTPPLICRLSPDRNRDPAPDSALCPFLIPLAGSSCSLLESTSPELCTGRAVVEALTAWEREKEGEARLMGEEPSEEWITHEPLLTMYRYTGDFDPSPPIGCSAESHSPALSCPSYKEVLQLEGVTETETDTDAPPCMATELQNTWETLQELRTYLCEAGGEAELGQGWVQAQRGEGEVAQQTSPSLMKRSASLAKLGCLQLSSNHLADWSPSLAESRKSTSLSASDPQLHNPRKNATKKLCVSPQSPHCQSHDATLPVNFSTTGGSGHCDDRSRSPLQATPLSQQATPLSQQATHPRLTAATWPQYKMMHSLKKLQKSSEKKRTPNFLYNTM
ncbi:LOW QUALITY PROTEIN: protein phosphatase Slingshot homolog 2-like [Brienomyrus brachyistius]|uniref:LOW QUALITY PROTEIN: protein phosphatase Slingshot homolog 2-like n=1 Tax=Brienomyrus brachyistius TaxID=42636 RepID=UPI0020B30505|nr:LOW QUALITY PROTEIN: protein phosphatase Slingshot homolog 2-like [Brienomyrus brachyistius]